LQKNNKPSAITILFTSLKLNQNLIQQLLTKLVMILVLHDLNCNLNTTIFFLISLKKARKVRDSNKEAEK